MTKEIKDDLQERFENTIYFKLAQSLEKQNNPNVVSDEEKIEAIKKIKADYDLQMRELEKERNAIIQKASRLIYERKVQEIISLNKI